MHMWDEKEMQGGKTKLHLFPPGWNTLRGDRERFVAECLNFQNGWSRTQNMNINSYPLSYIHNSVINNRKYKSWVSYFSTVVQQCSTNRFTIQTCQREAKGLPDTLIHRGWGNLQIVRYCMFLIDFFLAILSNVRKQWNMSITIS